MDHTVWCCNIEPAIRGNLEAYSLNNFDDNKEATIFNYMGYENCYGDSYTMYIFMTLIQCSI